MPHTNRVVLTVCNLSTDAITAVIEHMCALALLPRHQMKKVGLVCCFRTPRIVLLRSESVRLLETVEESDDEE